VSEQSQGASGGPTPPRETVGPAGSPGQPQYPPPAAPAQPGQPPRETLGSAPLASEFIGQPPPVTGPVAGQPPVKRKRRTLLWVLVGVGAFLVILIVGFVAAAVLLFGNSPATAQVGSCLSGTTDTAALNPDDMKVVGCDEAEASYKVIGRVGDKTQQESQAACEGVAGTELSLWYGAAGQRGVVLCLARLAT
jgi:hypothetical protein